MKKFLPIGLAAGVLVAGAGSGRAEISARDFLQHHSAASRGRVTVARTVERFNMANSYLDEKIYCLPSSTVLTPHQNVELVRRYLATAPEGEKDFPFGFVMLLSLRSAFPCRS